MQHGTYNRANPLAMEKATSAVIEATSLGSMSRSGTTRRTAVEMPPVSGSALLPTGETASPAREIAPSAQVDHSCVREEEYLQRGQRRAHHNNSLARHAGLPPQTRRCAVGDKPKASFPGKKLTFCLGAETID